MTAMLKNVIKSGTGAAANIGKPAAGKTGTTDDYKDASFIGYTPNVVTGVWVGNDDNTDNFKSVQGGTVPARMPAGRAGTARRYQQLSPSGEGGELYAGPDHSGSRK